MNKYPWIGFVIFIVLLNIAGFMSFDDLEQEVAAYCTNVEAGYWPDYKRIYYTECVGK